MVEAVVSSEGKVSQLAVQCPTRFVVINVDTNEPVSLEFPVIKKSTPLLMQPVNATEMLMAYTRTEPRLRAGDVACGLTHARVRMRCGLRAAGRGPRVQATASSST